MRKLLQFDAHYPKTGEATVQLAAFTRRDGRFAIEKRAFAESHSPIYDYLQHVQPEAGISYILVNALGSFEYYGANRNGDGFNERAYKPGQRARCGHPECTKSLDGWVAETETLLPHYKSFEKHGGIYEHHRNQDRAKSLGTIQLAVWNPYMHRVELLLRYVNERNPRIPQRLGSGDDLAVSMGCRVLYDVCTICGHHAPTRMQYCEHARQYLRQVLEDGQLVAVLNPSPCFFDISFVVKPADETGWTLMKVAHPEGPLVLSSQLGDELNSYDAVREVFEKIAVEVRDAWMEPASFMGRYVAEVGANTSAPADTARPRTQTEALKFAAAANDLPLTDSQLDRFTLATPGLLALCGRYPEYIKAADLGPYGDVLRQTAFEDPGSDIGPGALFRAAEPPESEVLSITDPFTGTAYQTTRGDAMRAERSHIKKKVLNTALFSALYAAGLHKTLKQPMSVTLPAALLLGTLTANKVEDIFTPTRNPTYMTDQGIPVSGLTEFKHAADDRWAFKLAQDITTRQGSYTPLRLLLRQQTHPFFAKWAALTPDAQADTLTNNGAASLDQLLDNLCRVLL